MCLSPHPRVSRHDATLRRVATDSLGFHQHKKKWAKGEKEAKKKKKKWLVFPPIHFVSTHM